MKAAPARWRALALHSRRALEALRAEQASELARHQRVLDTLRAELGMLRAERAALVNALDKVQRAELELVPGDRERIDALVSALRRRTEPGSLRAEPGSLRAEPGSLRAEPGSLRAEPDAASRAAAPGRGTCARCSCTCTLTRGLCRVCAREQGGA